MNTRDYLTKIYNNDKELWNTWKNWDCLVFYESENPKYTKKTDNIKFYAHWPNGLSYQELTKSIDSQINQGLHYSISAWKWSNDKAILQRYYQKFQTKCRECSLCKES